MLLLGFSSGLPFFLVGNTFGYWLRDEHTSLTAIGFLSWVGIAYSLKFLWAPLMDRVDLPLFKRLGHRRGWMMFSQIVVGLALSAMGGTGTKALPDGHRVSFLGGHCLFAEVSVGARDGSRRLAVV